MAAKTTKTATPIETILARVAVMAATLRALLGNDGIALTLYAVVVDGRVVHSATSKTSIVGHGPDCIDKRLAQGKVVHYPHPSTKRKGATVVKLSWSHDQMTELCQDRIEDIEHNAVATKHPKASEIRSILKNLDTITPELNPMVADAILSGQEALAEVYGLTVD